MIDEGSELKQSRQCPLCETDNSQHFHQSNNRDFYRCDNCCLVYVAAEHRLSVNKERQQYQLHKNQLNDPEYRLFLSRIFNPVTQRIPPPATVIDFGCGPGPALAEMFQESGYQVSVYDPFFYPDEKVLTDHYQIITCTEVIEHCFEPLRVLIQMQSLLLSGGVIGIMTKRLTQLHRFAEWHYKNDPTHVCFFADETFHWIADKLAMRLVFCGDDSLMLFE